MVKTVMLYLVMGSPLLLPLAATLVARRFARRRPVVQLLAAGLAAAAGGAFLASAAAAMATAVSTSTAMRRGALIGFGIGIVVGAATIGAAALIERWRAGTSGPRQNAA